MINDSVNLCAENERADAGRGGRTQLVRPDSQARMHFHCLVDNDQDYQYQR